MGENVTKAEMFNYTRKNTGRLLIQPPRKPAVSATNALCKCCSVQNCMFEQDRISATSAVT